MEENHKKLAKRTAVAVTIILFSIIFAPLKIVGASNKGLLLNWGAVNDTVLQPGIHFRLPFKQKIVEINIQPIQLDHTVAVGSDGAITKDNQTIGADLTVFYRYIPDRLPEMYKQYGEDRLKSIVTQTLRESFKDVVGGYDIFNLPISQNDIRNKVMTNMVAKLSAYPIELTELKIVNYDWSDDFDNAIKKTMESAQQVKQKEQELLVTQQEAQKKVKEAEADKQAMITRAEGDKEAARLNAEAKQLEGEGIRKYNESIAQKWDIELKKLELANEKSRIEKWNGQYVSTNNYTPIPLSQGSLLGK